MEEKRRTATEAMIQACEKSGQRLIVHVSSRKHAAEMRRRVAHAPTIRVALSEPGGTVTFLAKKKS